MLYNLPIKKPKFVEFYGNVSRCANVSEDNSLAMFRIVTPYMTVSGKKSYDTWVVETEHVEKAKTFCVGKFIRVSGYIKKVYETFDGKKYLVVSNATFN